MRRSWQTTLAGIIAGLIILLTQLGNLIDGDPETVLTWERIVVALGIMGIGAFARDNNKTSKTAGAK